MDMLKNTKPTIVSGEKSLETKGSQTLPSGVWQENLEGESLTSMQLLNKSGSHLMTSMEKAGLVPMETVALAKALASTIQVQVNILRLAKEFQKK